MNVFFSVVSLESGKTEQSAVTLKLVGRDHDFIVLVPY